MEPALKLVEPEEVGQKAMTYVDQISSLPPIKTAEQYLLVDQLWKAGKELLVEISAGYDDLIKAAHKLHKDAIAKKDKYYKPAEAGVKAAKKLMSDYDEEQERIRQIEERRLAEIARKQEEERRLAEAIAAEEELKAAGATQEEIAQEVETIIEAPVVVAPVIIPKTVPKVSGGAIFQTRWFASVTDIRALCKAVGEDKASTEYVMGLEKDKVTGNISSPALNKVATALKQSMRIPGVQALSKRV